MITKVSLKSLSQQKSSYLGPLYYPFKNHTNLTFFLSSSSLSVSQLIMKFSWVGFWRFLFLMRIWFESYFLNFSAFYIFSFWLTRNPDPQKMIKEPWISLWSLYLIFFNWAFFYRILFFTKNNLWLIRFYPKTKIFNEIYMYVMLLIYALKS